MDVVIDQKSGFCFGVVNAIRLAEDALAHNEPLYCLGDIVHNSKEVDRLAALGLRSIDHAIYYTLSGCTVLLRAHGEAPAVYEYARLHQIKLIDATCPVVLKLQQRIKTAADEMAGKDGQVVIFGKKGHAEVIGLNGQTGNRAIVLEHPDEYVRLDLSKPTTVFSQTTKSIDDFNSLSENIRKSAPHNQVTIHDTICRQVSNRGTQLREFALQHDVVVFVGGEKSSNARFLFGVCQKANPRSYFVSASGDLDPAWFTDARSVGISGATSTPQWLMEELAQAIRIL